MCIPIHFLHIHAWISLKILKEKLYKKQNWTYTQKRCFFSQNGREIQCWRNGCADHILNDHYCRCHVCKNKVLKCHYTLIQNSNGKKFREEMAHSELVDGTVKERVDWRRSITKAELEITNFLVTQNIPIRKLKTLLALFQDVILRYGWEPIMDVSLSDTKCSMVAKKIFYELEKNDFKTILISQPLMKALTSIPAPTSSCSPGL